MIHAFTTNSRTSFSADRINTPLRVVLTDPTIVAAAVDLVTVDQGTRFDILVCEEYHPLAVHRGARSDETMACATQVMTRRSGLLTLENMRQGEKERYVPQPSGNWNVVRHDVVEYRGGAQRTKLDPDMPHMTHLQ